jgi:hypothetical protein
MGSWFSLPMSYQEFGGGGIGSLDMVTKLEVDDGK